MTAAPISFSSTPSGPDLVEVFMLAYPVAYREIKDIGYEPAGPDMLGRCHGVATLFLELSQGPSKVRGWVWDLEQEEFVGPTYEVTGPLDLAIARARELIESSYTEDQMSGTAPRYTSEVFEASDVS